MPKVKTFQMMGRNFRIEPEMPFVMLETPIGWTLKTEEGEAEMVCRRTGTIRMNPAFVGLRGVPTLIRIAQELCDTGNPEEAVQRVLGKDDVKMKIPALAA